MHRVLQPIWGVETLSLFSCLSVLTPRRHLKHLVIPGVTGHYYQNQPIKKAGVDELVRHTEVYDGYTDDYGLFKEGPPLSIRLEYIRLPEYQYTENVDSKLIWSPFEAEQSYNHYTPLYYDYQEFHGRDYFGHHSFIPPGAADRDGFYRVRRHVWHEERVMHNMKPQKRIPKWLACIIHYKKQRRFIGFFLYANGAYVAENLTYKQLPRLVYNRPFQSVIPTLGQTVSLSEVTYGKEIHNLEMIPGLGGTACRSAGTSAVVLRGTEPGLVPILLPSKEVRLFDTTSNGVFGRNAGVMYRENRYQGSLQVQKFTPCRPVARQGSMRMSDHPSGGGRSNDPFLVLRLNRRKLPFYNIKTQHWLCGYILRGRRYQQHLSASDIKAKSYSWASRDRVYR